MELRSGDETAFRRVYETVFPVLIKVAYHVTYNMESAEDIVQDAFIRFYDKNMVFPSEDDAKYWLIRVTKNLAINQVKKKARETASVEKLKHVSPVSSYNDGVSDLLLQEATENVRRAIAALSEKYRMVIILKEYADLDYKSIGKILGISESNVKVRVHRARKELEDILNEENE